MKERFAAVQSGRCIVGVLQLILTLHATNCNGGATKLLLLIRSTKNGGNFGKMRAGLAWDVKGILTGCMSRQQNYNFLPLGIIALISAFSCFRSPRDGIRSLYQDLFSLLNKIIRMIVVTR